MENQISSVLGNFEFIPLIANQIITIIILSFLYPYISKKIEHGVKSKYDKDLEIIRSNLHRLNSEHQVRFAKLQEQQALAIAEVYGKLKKLHFDLVQYTKPLRLNGEQDLDSAAKVAFASYRSFTETYITKLIYFQKDVADKLVKINSDINRAFVKFQYGVDMAGQSGNYSMTVHQDVFNTVIGEINDSLTDIEDSFRSILGITPSLT